MDDLVKKLRDRQVCSIAQNSCRNDWRLEQAADRIEELNKAFEAYATEMVERVDKLESVLEEIADHNRHGWTMQTEIARAALGEKKR